MLEEGLDTAQYLTLLVHLGAVSATREKDGQYIFRSTSEQYRKKHLSALNYILTESILDLLNLPSKEEMYKNGEKILANFFSALSQHRMQLLIDWASSAKGNRILELQFQGKILEELHAEFSTIYSARATQEDKVGSGRSDITIHGQGCMIVLELKKKDGPKEPTARNGKNTMLSYELMWRSTNRKTVLRWWWDLFWSCTTTATSPPFESYRIIRRSYDDPRALALGIRFG
jgi:uncharacterized protein (UPF0305 family)